MENMSLLVTYGLQWGVVLSVVMTVAIVASLWINAEMWLHDAPKEIQLAHGPMSERAKRQRVWVALIVFGALIGISWWTILQMTTSTGIERSFTSVFVVLFTVLMTFNLVDLLVIDWLIVETWRPRILYTSKLSALMTKPNYLFHFIGFLKGSVMLAVVSLVVAGVVAWLNG